MAFQAAQLIELDLWLNSKINCCWCNEMKFKSRERGSTDIKLGFR